MVEILDSGLQHLADVIKRDFGKDLANVAGAGAAGGLGFGALFFLNAALKEGVSIVMEQTHFEQHLTNADLILTGEGKIDHQTLQGKLIAGIVQAGRRHGVPTVAICGALLASPQDLQQLGLAYATSIISRPMTLDEALQTAHQGVVDAVCHLLHFWGNSLPKTSPTNA
jgi:glycerate kinase